jgi:hypothetical protein
LAGLEPRMARHLKILGLPEVSQNLRTPRSPRKAAENAEITHMLGNLPDC